MMKLFSFLICALFAPLAGADDFSPLFMQMLGKIGQSYNIDPGLQTETSTYENNTFEKATFSIDAYQYRLIVKNQDLITFSSKQDGHIAFTVVAQGHHKNQTFARIQAHIDTHKGQSAATSKATAGYKSILEDPPTQKQEDVISTANVLGWNRLLKDAYQGNVSSSLSSAPTSTSAESSYDQAASMAKMMNQCGGNNKSHQAQKQALQNIAQALVISESDSHKVARASESYADQSKNYKKQGKESILETLERINHVDTAKLFQDLQSEKRKIEKSLQRDELSYIFTSDPLDQNTLKILQTLIEKYSRIKTLTNFQHIGRKLVIDQTYFKKFAQQSSRSFFYIAKNRTWTINPLLTSDLQYRKALVEILWSHMNKE